MFLFGFESRLICVLFGIQSIKQNNKTLFYAWCMMIIWSIELDQLLKKHLDSIVFFLDGPKYGIGQKASASAESADENVWRSTGSVSISRKSRENVHWIWSEFYLFFLAKPSIKHWHHYSFRLVTIYVCFEEPFTKNIHRYGVEWSRWKNESGWSN